MDAQRIKIKLIIKTNRRRRALSYAIKKIKQQKYLERNKFDIVLCIRCLVFIIYVYYKYVVALVINYYVCL